MAGVSPSRRVTAVEEVRYKGAVSEAVAQKLAGSANFINLRQYDQKDFRLNGPFNVADLPHLGADGIYVFPFPTEIINIAAYIETPGSSGTTEFDVKRSTNSGTSWSSIFSTTPKITSAASGFHFALAYDIADNMDNPPGYQDWAAAAQPTGFTAAVLSGGAPFSVNAGDAIRGDLIQAAVAAENFQLIIFHRPRN